MTQMTLDRLGQLAGRLLQIFALLGGALSVLAALVAFILEPVARPYLESIASIETLRDDVARLSVDVRAAGSARRNVEFIGSPYPFSPSARPGERISLVYALTRNAPCETEVVVRWWSVEAGGFDTQHTRRMVPVRAPATGEPALVTFLLTIPKLSEGVWAYFPEMVGIGPECLGERISPPPAYIKIEGA